MIANVFIILPIPNVHSSLWNIVTDVDESTARKNNLGTKIVVKLYVGDDGSSHAILNGKQKYTHSEIMAELKKPEWIDLSKIPE